MSFGLVPVINLFVMSNMTPQYCQFNRGVWQILESLTRFWVNTFGTVYVVTGSIFANSAVKRMKSNNGKSRVAIPTHFYKILLRQDSDGKVSTLSFIVPHDQTDVNGHAALDYLEQHLTSIDDVEAATGLNFFPAVSASSPSTEKAVEKVKATALWEVNRFKAKSLVDDRCRATAGM